MNHITVDIHEPVPVPERRVTIEVPISVVQALIKYFDAIGIWTNRKITLLEQEALGRLYSAIACTKDYK